MGLRALEGPIDVSALAVPILEKSYEYLLEWPGNEECNINLLIRHWIRNRSREQSPWQMVLDRPSPWPFHPLADVRADRIPFIVQGKRQVKMNSPSEGLRVLKLQPVSGHVGQRLVVFDVGVRLSLPGVDDVVVLIATPQGDSCHHGQDEYLRQTEGQSGCHPSILRLHKSAYP